MAGKKYKYILFDVDGTLTDPKIGIMRSIDWALKKVGIVEENFENLARFVGTGVRKSFMEFYGLDEELAKKASSYYGRHWSELGILEADIYPGMGELLAELKEQGKRLFVATSKPTFYANPIMKHWEIDHFFDAIIGSNLDGTRVDKGEVISYIFENYIPNVDRNEVVMVGDTVYDIVGAKNNGIDCISVTYGYGIIDELQAHEPTLVVDSVKELGDVLKG